MIRVLPGFASLAPQLKFTSICVPGRHTWLRHKALEYKETDVAQLRR